MISVREAKKIVSELNITTKKVEIPLTEAMGFVLSEDILSPINMPPFDQSAMDGYALKYGQGLSYNIVGEVQAGSSMHPKLKHGEAVRIFTGSAVPSDADAIIMQEKTKQKGSKLLIDEKPFKKQNIRPCGEQIKTGEIALKKGTLINPAAIGFLAGLGIEYVSVYEKPNISIIATGNELVRAGNKLKRGQIYESNCIMLESVIKSNGFEIQASFHIKDNYTQTIDTIKQLIKTNKFIIISGGISVGDYDFVGKALAELDVHQLFYKVRQKPGKPIFMGRKGDCTIFALPGNPAASLSCFYEYVLTALKLAAGEKDFSLKKLFLPLVDTYNKKGDRAHFLKAKIIKKGVQILSKQSSAMLFSFAEANALVYIPEDKYFTQKGELVEVHLLP
ncbi:MAG: molybdopterin molybdotransferase MoeA [Saprospiraceae bacterium]|nr:molybdopterin molybdotransferase MoeA [Saprospiraceae bacterium]